MKIYHYHPITKAYISSSEARLSPLEKDVYLIPSHATEITPPNPIEGKVRIFKNGEWLQADMPRNPDEIPRVLTDEELKERDIQDLIFKLVELDKYIDRPKENIIKFLMTQGYVPYQKEIEVIEEKETIRQQLRELQGG